MDDGFIGLGVGVLFIVFLIFKSVIITKQKEANIVERLGKFNGIRRAGLSFIIPFVDRVAYNPKPKN